LLWGMEWNSNSVASEIFWNNQTQSWKLLCRSGARISKLGYIALLNGLTRCFLVLLIPSYIITKISPVTRLTDYLASLKKEATPIIRSSSFFMMDRYTLQSSPSLCFIRDWAFHYYP
jgi:hypothetical protein